MNSGMFSFSFVGDGGVLLDAEACAVDNGSKERNGDDGGEKERIDERGCWVRR